MKFNTDKIREDIRRLGLLLFVAGLFALIIDYGSTQGAIGLVVAGLLLAFAGCLEKNETGP